MSLPNIELKYTKTTEKHDANTNTNNNSLSNSNTVIINQQRSCLEHSDNKIHCPGDDICCHPDDMTVKQPAIQKSSSSQSISRSETPLNIKQFKETFMAILIGYFKNNIILLNNLVELSDKIITKISDLTLLISLLLVISQSKIDVLVDEVSTTTCCGKICRQLPRYRKINDIIIDKKQSFKVYYNQFYVQLQTEYNISLDFVLL
jgi:hypothetical protein